MDANQVKGKDQKDQTNKGSYQNREQRLRNSRWTFYWKHEGDISFVLAKALSKSFQEMRFFIPCYTDVTENLYQPQAYDLRLIYA